MSHNIKKLKCIIGVHMWPTSAIKMIDKGTSMSWLRAFEKLSMEGHKCSHNHRTKL